MKIKIVVSVHGDAKVKGTDDITRDVNWPVLPRVGDTIFLGDAVECTVISIFHDILDGDSRSRKPKITVYVNADSGDEYDRLYKRWMK